ncbi:MAG TPA: TMEM165/GDT1 family protein [Firmicutes bacterium]|jgi:putative Ca2+/H+ antiporter (TMEM165/GDT1 family)|nr:TMEM165/GDT1 family protein [Bacillota bacterium]
MLTEVAKAAALIFIAELGDKTQILAMAFALQFSLRQVLAGVALGSLLNHGLAVVIGAYLAHIIPLSAVRLGSAFLFLGFGLWTLWSRDEGDQGAAKSSGHPILVVTLAFFLGELGDKTQLTAIALASSASFPFAILVGTVLGMVITSFVGIFIGTKLGERIPDFAMKLLSGAVFIGFGLFHLSQTVPAAYLTPANIALVLVALIGLIAILILPPLRARRMAASGGSIKTVASQLYALNQALDHLCLHEASCRGQNCPVGYCKRLLMEEFHAQKSDRKPKRPPVRKPYLKKDQVFDTRVVDEALRLVRNADLNPALSQELLMQIEKLKR